MKTFSGFCAESFLCLWNKALLNIVLLFIVALGFVNLGKHFGLLMGSADPVQDFGTAFIVVLMMLVIGAQHKIRANTDDSVHDC